MKKNLLILVALSITNFANADCQNSSCTDEVYSNEINGQVVSLDEDFNTNSSIKRANNFYQANNGDYYDVSGIGYGIDSIKGKYGCSDNIKNSNSIIDSTTLDTLLADGVLNSAVNQNYYTLESTNSMSDLETKFSSNLNYSSSVSLDIPLFAASCENSFSLGTSIDYSEYFNAYFFHAYDYSTRYNFTLSNTADSSQFQDNLDTYYVSSLDKLFDGTIEYNDFFDTYGTHLVAGGSYGGTCDLYYSAVSDSIDLDISADVGMSIESELSGYLTSYAQLSAETSFEFNLSADYGTSSSNTQDKFYSISYGGQPFMCTSIDSLSSAFSEWVTTIDASPSMIKMNNLIPLWDILPSKYDDSEHQQILKDYFVEYAQENEADISQYNCVIPTSPISCYTAERDTNLYTISSTDKYTNSYDYIDLKKSGYSPKLLSDNGFNVATIFVTLYMNETTDGYERVYLYSSDIENVAYQIGSYYIYYGGNDAPSTSYANCVFKFTIPVSAISDEEELIIRYGGNGTWNIKKTSVKISYSIC